MIRGYHIAELVLEARMKNTKDTIDWMNNKKSYEIWQGMIWKIQKVAEGPEYTRYMANLPRKEIDKTGERITRLRIRQRKNDEEIKEIIECKN